MSYGSERPLDDVDWSILRELQSDARLSFSQLGRRVNMSAPAVAERVRRMERDGVITGYRVSVDTAAVGLPVSAFVTLTCDRSRCLLRTSKAGDYPEVVEVHKLGGPRCTMLRLRATSIEHLDGAVERIGTHGRTEVTIVLATEFEGRPVEQPKTDTARPTPSQGWHQG